MSSHFLTSSIGKLDWCQWRQPVRGCDQSLPTGNSLRVLKCPWHSWFPSIRRGIGRRAFLWQRGSHLRWWLRQWNASITRWCKKFIQQTCSGGIRCHCIDTAASTPRQFNLLPQKISIQGKQPHSQKRREQKEPSRAHCVYCCCYSWFYCWFQSSSAWLRFWGEPLFRNSRKHWTYKDNQLQQLRSRLSWWQWYHIYSQFNPHSITMFDWTLSLYYNIPVLNSLILNLKK